MAKYDNMDILLEKVRFHVQDTKITDIQLKELILLSIEDIANATNIFKKIYGFTVHSDVSIYDFNALSKINETTEEELSDATLMPLTPEQIEDFFATMTLPNPDIDKSLFVEADGQSTFIQVLDIFDEDLASAITFFKYRGTSEYIVTNQDWLDEHDLEHFAYTASVIPNIDELLPEDLARVTSAIIQGVKYYANDTLTSAEDSQVANVFYQRFFVKTQALINQFPTQIISEQNTTQQKRWV